MGRRTDRRGAWLAVVSLAALQAALAEPALAQQSAPAAAGAPTTVSEIVVTGIRASKQQSLAKKRVAISVMDVVSAEEVGKLPDKNVADAVQRIAGVNISSGSGGEGGFSENDRVSIRGTNPSLTQTTVNGHTIATGDWYIGDQAGTVGRSVSFTLLPSEIVGSVELQKSSQADYIEGGTAGNVNIVTRKPLDFKQPFTFNGLVQSLYADLPDEADPQGNALISWKNDSNTFGVLVQGFYEARHERRDGQELFLLGSATIDPTSPAALAHPDLANVAYPTQIGSAAFTQHSTRQGGLFDVQWRPSDRLQLDVNGFYSKFEGTNFDTNFMASPVNMLGANQVPTSYVLKNGTLEAASFANPGYDPTDPNPGADLAFPGVRDSIYRPNAGSSAGYLDFDVRWQPTDNLLVTAQAGYTRGTGQTPHDYGYEAFLVNAGLVYTMHGTSRPADVSFPGLDPTNFNDPNHVVNGGSWSDSVFVTDEETYGQADAAWTLDLGPIKTVKFGLRYAEHKRTDTQTNYGCSIDPNNACYTNPQVVLPMPAWRGTVSPSNFGQGLGVDAGFLSHFWVLNPNDIAAWEQTYNNVNLGPNYQGEFTVDEKDAAGYVMANFGWERLTGDVGVRLVNTDQLSSSWNVDVNGNFTPASVKHDYTKLLPSLNLKYDISKDLVARFAFSETLSRADYSALSPAVTLNNLDHTGSGGDADLKPIRSTNYDLGLEWYFKPQSILSVGLFYMDMPTYVAFGASYRPYLDTSLDQIRQFLITSPINVAAHEEGVELSWQQPLIWGFGALANYTYAEGKTSQGQALVGSSKSTANAEFYYENKSLSARIAYTYRSSFLVGLSNVTPQYEGSQGTLAASLNYKINDHVSFEFDGLNLNNPVLKYYSNTAQPQAFYSNGRQFFLGLRFSL